MRRRRRLYARIYLHFVGVLLVVGVLSSLIAAMGWRRSFLRTHTLRLVRHAAGELGLQPDAAARQTALRRISDELDLELTLRAPDGQKLIAHAGPELAPLDPEDAEEARRHALPLRHGREWVTAAPLHDRAGALVGLLVVAPMHRFSAINLLRPAAWVALTLLVVGMATFPLARRISRPVERLTEASRRLGAGDLAYRVPLDDGECAGDRPRRRRGWRHHRRHHHPDDELSHLTRAWNEMAERVEGLVRGQRELLANVSHELRSPLARILVALELLPEDARTRARIDDVKADLGELERLIDDVLTTARLDATGLPMHLDEVQVAPLLRQLVERAQHDPLTAGKIVRISDGADGGALPADGALLKRALWNLIENAAKYGAAPITLAATRSNDQLVLSVSDQGAGVPPELRARVFDPFFRADKARTPALSDGVRTGFGLGLTLAKRVAEVHGGSIAISDGDGGRGCVVSLTLPLQRRSA